VYSGSTGTSNITSPSHHCHVNMLHVSAIMYSDVCLCPACMYIALLPPSQAPEGAPPDVWLQLKECCEAARGQAC